MKIIDELIQQCTTEWAGGGPHSFDSEKFTKLLVKECCKQLEKEQYEHFDINRVPRTFYNAALYDGIVAIKKHFGVEE